MLSILIFLGLVALISTATCRIFSVHDEKRQAMVSAGIALLLLINAAINGTLFSGFSTSNWGPRWNMVGPLLLLFASLGFLAAIWIFRRKR